MKHLKACLSLLVCLALLLGMLAACGKEKTNAVTYGRYVEEDLSLEGMNGFPMAFASFADGTRDLILWNYTHSPGDQQSGVPYLRWRSPGGEGWQQQDMAWTAEYSQDYSKYWERNEQPPEMKSLGNMIPLENGDLLAVVNTEALDAETDMYTRVSEVYRVGLNAEMTPYSLATYEAAKEDGREVTIDNMQALPGGLLYLQLNVMPTIQQQNDPDFDWSSTRRTMVCDVASGKKLYDITVPCWQVYSNSDTLYLYDYEHGMNALNLADGSPSPAPLPTPAALQQAMNTGANLVVDNEGFFYTVSARGMQKLPQDNSVPGAGAGASLSQSAGEGASQAVPPATSEPAGENEPTMVMDGINYTYGSPLYGISTVLYEPESGAFLLAVTENNNANGSCKLLRYTWDDKAIATSDKMLKVYSLYENQMVRLGLSEFKRQNPEVMLEYEPVFRDDDLMSRDGLAYSNTPDDPEAEAEAEKQRQAAAENQAKTLEDAQRVLNTELLNGTGPDVLVLDGLPVESFIEKGVLADLAAPVKDAGGLLEPVFTPLYRNGKLYTVPTGFFAPTLFGEKGAVEQYTSLESLLAAIEAGPTVPGQESVVDESWTEAQLNAYYEDLYRTRSVEERPVLRLENLDDAFSALYATSAPAIFSEKGGIDKEQLSLFLSALKRLSDKYNLAGKRSDMYLAGHNAYSGYTYSMSLDSFSQLQSRTGYSLLGSAQVLDLVSVNLFYTTDPNMHAVAEPVAESVIDGAEEAKEGVADAEEAVPEASLPVEDDSGSFPDGLDDDGQGGASQKGAPKIPTAITPAMVGMPGLAQGVYHPTQIMGVTTTSKQLELARDFVSVMLSIDVQKHNLGSGFPVTRAAMDIQKEKYEASNATYRDEGITMMPFTYQALVDNFSTPMLDNQYLRETIFKPVPAFCAGQTSLEDTVSQIVSATELYFAERQ